jgi:hypothetical protein
MQRLAYADKRHGPPHMLKFDLDNGYCRVHLSPEAALELAVVLPSDNQMEHLVGIPLSLPMGWTYSLPYFCAFTETAADLANAAIQENHPPRTHPLVTKSQHTATPVPKADSFSPLAVHPPTMPAASPPLIYIDDFLAIAQKSRLLSTLQHTLQGIFSIFRDTLDPVDASTRKHIISHSKLQKGDAAWSTSKTILGWLFNTEDMTISQPPHKADPLHSILTEFTNKTRTSRKQWQRLLGELRHMSTAIRGAKFLFSMLQSVLTEQKGKRLRIHHNAKAALQDWSYMASLLQQHPVPIATLVPKAPSNVGAVDASGSGCGGFWIDTQYGHLDQPIVFRWEFPANLQQLLVSHTNPTGCLTNSHFELAAIVAGAAVLQTNANTTAASIFLGSDNTPAMSWGQRGSPSSTGANTHLLRLLAQLSRADNFTLDLVSIPGSTNTIANFCSCSFHLTNQAFLNALNERYPVIQPWRLAQLTPDIIWRLTSSLLQTHLPWGCVPPGEALPTTPSTSGSPSASTITLTPPWNNTKTQSHCSKSPVIDTAKATLLPAKLKSVVERWATPFEPWARRSPNWVTPTHGFNHPENWMCVSPGSFLHTPKPTPLHPASNQSQSTCCSKPPQSPACLHTHYNKPLQTC